MAEMLMKIDPESYIKYAALTNDLYGNLLVSVLFWIKLSAKVVTWGYRQNPYDLSVANKDIRGKQCTILWHVDDLKLSHVSKKVLDD